MGLRKRRKLEEEGPNAGKEVRFDLQSRYAFLSGFRKRKLERRKAAIEKAMERERQQRIEVKREHRDDVKAKWREVQVAEKRAEKLVDAIRAKKLALMDSRRQLALGDGGDAAELEDGGDKAADIEAQAEAEAEAEAGLDLGPGVRAIGAPVTVSFDLEDDDPFGGCEVTTIVGGVADEQALWPTLQREAASAALVMRELRLRGTRGGRKNAKASVEEEPEINERGETLEERNKRRAVSFAKEEARRKAALQKRITKSISEKERWKKKGKKKKKPAKSGKTTHSARRKRK